MARTNEEDGKRSRGKSCTKVEDCDSDDGVVKYAKGDIYFENHQFVDDDFG